MPDGPTSPEEATKEPSMKDASEKRGPLLDRLTGARKGKSSEASPKPKEKPEAKTTTEKVEREADTREDIEEALYTSFGLLEATDDSKLSPELQWAKRAVRETIHKTLDHDRDTARVDFDSEYSHFSIEEGIPVDHVIEFLNKKINATKDSAEREIWRERRDILLRNSVAFYDVDSSRSNPEQMVARTRYEAYLVGQDSRNKGNDAENWETAEQQLSKRRELFLTPRATETPTEADEPEEKFVTEKTTTETPEEATPKPTEEPEFIGPVKPTWAEREFISVIGRRDDAIKNNALFERYKTIREEMARGSNWDPRNWMRKVGLRLGEDYFGAKYLAKSIKAKYESASTRARAAFEGNTVEADFKKAEEQEETKLGLKRAKEGKIIEGEKVTEATGELRKKIIDELLSPIVDGKITSEKDLQKRITEFVKANQDNEEIKAIFGPEASKYGEWADFFATDLVELGAAIKETMDTHKVALEQLDSQIKIRIANLSWTAEQGAAKAGRIDKMVMAMQKRGGMLNPATIGLAASVTAAVGLRVAGGTAQQAQFVIPGAGAIAGGAVAGLRRYHDMNVDRPIAQIEDTYSQWAPEGNRARRESLAQRDYDRAHVGELINGSGTDLVTGEERESISSLLSKDLSEGQETNRQAVLRRVAEIEKRLGFSRKEGIDLIRYDSQDTVQHGRLALLEAAISARNKLKEAGMSDEQIKSEETKLSGEWEKKFIEDRQEQDRAFAGYRLRNAAGSALFGGLAGLGAGALIQEGVAVTGRALGVNVGETGLEWAAKNLGGVGKGAKAAASEIRSNATASVIQEAQVSAPKPSAAAIKEVVETTIVNQDRPVLGPNGEWTKNAINVDERIWEKGNSQLLHTIKDGNKLGLDITRMTENVQKLVQNGQIGFAFTTNDGQTVFIPENSDMVKDGVLWLDPNAEGQRGVISKMVLNQEALGKYANGNIATELHNRKDVFNVKYIEAAQMVQDGNKNVLHAYATIQGTGNMPSSIEVPTETPRPITETPKPIQTPPGQGTETPRPIQTPSPSETPRPITTPTPSASPTPTPTPGGGFDFGIPRNGPEVQMPPVIPVPFSPRHPLEPIAGEKPTEAKKEESKGPTDPRLEAIGIASTSPKAPEAEKSVSPEEPKELKIEVGKEIIQRDGDKKYVVAKEDDKRVTLERRREDGSLETRVTLDRKDLEEKLKTPGSAWKTSDVTPEPEGPRPEPEITEDDQAVRQELTKLLHGQIDPNMRLEMARARLAELKGEAAAPKETEATAETRNVKSFKTELGSVYTYDAEGKSTRLTPDGETHSRKDVTVFVKLNDIETDTYMNALQNPETFGHVYVFEKQGEELKQVRDIKDVANPDEVYVGIFKDGKIGKLNKASTEPVKDHNVFEMGKTDEGFTARHLGHKVTDIEFEETAPAPSIPTPSSTTTSSPMTPRATEEGKPVVETVSPTITEEPIPAETASIPPQRDEIPTGTFMSSTPEPITPAPEVTPITTEPPSETLVVEPYEPVEEEAEIPPGKPIFNNQGKIIGFEPAVEVSTAEAVTPTTVEPEPTKTEGSVEESKTTEEPLTFVAPSAGPTITPPIKKFEPEVELPPTHPAAEEPLQVESVPEPQSPTPTQEKTSEYIIPTDNPVEALRRIVDMKPEQIREIYKKEFGKEWEGTTTDLKFELGQEAVRQAYVREGRGPKIESTLPEPTVPEEPLGESLEDLEARKDLTKLLHGQVDPNMPIETVRARLEQLKKPQEERLEETVKITTEKKEAPQEKLDAIIVLGKNIGEEWDAKRVREQRFQLSPHSRLNVLAAGLLYKAGYTDKIIFSTGHTAGKGFTGYGKPFLSEAQAMKNHLLRVFKDIPESAIELEEESLDTRGNAEEVRKIIQKNNLKSVGLLTTGFHLDRAKMLFGKENIAATPFASDQVLKDKRAKLIESYLKSELVQKEIKKEKTAKLIQSLPLGPQLLRMVVKLTRGERVSPKNKPEKKPETKAVKTEVPAETAEEDKKKKGRNGKNGRPEILNNSRMRGKRFSELTTRIKKNISKRKK